MSRSLTELTTCIWGKSGAAVMFKPGVTRYQGSHGESTFSLGTRFRSSADMMTIIIVSLPHPK